MKIKIIKNIVKSREKYNKSIVKTIFHYVLSILKYIDGIKELRKTAYIETKYLENIGKLINEKIDIKIQIRFNLKKLFFTIINMKVL